MNHTESTLSSDIFFINKSLQNYFRRLIYQFIQLLLNCLMIRGATYGRKNYQIATIKYESFGQVG